jgi:hypothetical protein
VFDKSMMTINTALVKPIPFRFTAGTSRAMRKTFWIQTIP